MTNFGILWSKKTFIAFSILMHKWHPDFLSDRFSCVNICVSMPLSSSFTYLWTLNLQKRRLSQTICAKWWLRPTMLSWITKTWTTCRTCAFTLLCTQTTLQTFTEHAWQESDARSIESNCSVVYKRALVLLLASLFI